MSTLSLFFPLLAAGLYATSAWGTLHRRYVLALFSGWLALALHGVDLFPRLVLPAHSLNLNVQISLLGFAWLVALVILIANLWRPLAILTLAVMTGNALILALRTVLPSSPPVAIEVDNPLLLGHIVVSSLAYALLTIAAGQAILLWFADRALRQKKVDGWVSSLPSIHDLESLLFQVLWTGQVLLTLSLASGMVFSELIFGRPFVWSHHFVLSAITWGMFTALLVGRVQLGWRAKQAARWVLVGYALLVLSYFGAKFVLEFILQRY